MIHKYLVIVTGTEGYKFVKEIHPFAVATDVIFTENHTALAVRTNGGEIFDPVLFVETDNDDASLQLEKILDTLRLRGLVVGHRKLDS